MDCSRNIPKCHGARCEVLDCLAASSHPMCLGGAQLGSGRHERNIHTQMEGTNSCSLKQNIVCLIRVRCRYVNS